MHHKILEQFTLFKQPSSWENCAGWWFTSCKQKWYMDLPGSACAPRFTYISTVFGCHTISSDYQSTTVWTHFSWTYHWGLERSWHFDTTWSSPFQQNYEDISHIFRCTFGEHFWMVGWQKKKSKACVACNSAKCSTDSTKHVTMLVTLRDLPSLGHSQQPQPLTFLPSPFWPQLSGPKNASWQE